MQRSLREELHQVRVEFWTLCSANNVTALSQHKSPMNHRGRCYCDPQPAAGDSHECRDALLGCECAASRIRCALTWITCPSAFRLSHIRNLDAEMQRIFCLIDAGVSAVIEALVKHAAEPAVAQAACAALRNIAVDSWGGSMSRFSSPACSVGAILDADGPAAIVEAMQACADSMPVQVHGCGALRNFE